MPWRVINGRDRALLVCGAESGHPVFTRQAERALQFRDQESARRWIERNTRSVFGELALAREPRSPAPKNKSPERGLAGAQKGNSTRGQNTTFPGSSAA